MNEQDKQKMDAFGITSELKRIYYYKGLAYDRLSDAVNYAEIIAERARRKNGA